LRLLFQQTYDNAVAKCKAKGMEIVQAETILENMCVQRLILKNGTVSNKIAIWLRLMFVQFDHHTGKNNDRFWMGLTKLGGKTNYTTWDNGKPLTYWDFAPNTVGATEQCANYLYANNYLIVYITVCLKFPYEFQIPPMGCLYVHLNCWLHM
jgi:hypothetical protein